MRASRPIEGEGFILCVFKEASWTSHDAVQRVRRILGLRKVGHTGTLDPFATGILLCCVGRATKLANYLMDLTKQYEGEMHFGAQTTTGDVCGEVTRTWSLPVPDMEALRARARAMEGELLQTPPMVSALKHEGRRLYQLARRGITVEREPRKVYVESFEILAANGPHIAFRVRCARGTYVRTLVEDFGASFGASAYAENLCRTGVGQFRVEEAIRLTDVLSAEELRARAVSMAAALQHLPIWRVPPFWVTKLRQGHAPPWLVLEVERPPRPGEVGRLLGGEGHLVALGRVTPIPGPADRPWQEALQLELLRVI